MRDANVIFASCLYGAGLLRAPPFHALGNESARAKSPNAKSPPSVCPTIANRDRLGRQRGDERGVGVCARQPPHADFARELRYGA